MSTPDSSSSDDELFNLADFEGISVSISLENLTSKTGIKANIKVLGDVAAGEFDTSSSIRLMEFFAAEHGESVALDVPAKTAATGHSLILFFDVSGAPMPFAFEAKGTVSVAQSITPERDRLIVDLTEVDTRFFEALKNLYSDRQKRIEEFLMQAKG